MEGSGGRWVAEIALEGVSKVYADGTRAVDSLDLDIADGEFMVLVGPSGCGKTTALRMVAGLEQVTDGTIRIGDRTVNDLPSRDRDIARVVQNYALYPHMSVYDNMAFGLQLRKMPKDEIDRRVKEAAHTLGLEEFLIRKPKALSGGQRQRVAMGRAIVREPRAFLMDEPLSNLDAKLRVQMRAEIAKIQHNLGVTTIYVTHDQTEAMTMGDRVAVIKKGVLQQVDAPQTLYERPRNLFVAGFIGSPAMNIVMAKLSRGGGSFEVEFGGIRLRVGEEAIAARRDLERFDGKEVILGIRPEDMEDASLVSDASQDSRITSNVDLREALGSQVLVHFTVHSPVVMTDDTRELAVAAGAEGLAALEQQAGEATSTFVAQLSPRTALNLGDRLEVVVDTNRLHFFDPETGLGIYGSSES
jgi:multiple sugar transport system ATP-binding protein